MPDRTLLDTLIDDHRAFRGLIEQILETIDDDPEGARLLLGPARNAILAHARAENRVLYVALDDADPELSHQGREEHAVVEMLLDELADTLVVDDAFAARVRIVADLLDRHIDEEERGLAGRDLDHLLDDFICAKGRELLRLGDQDAAEALLDGDQVVRGMD